MEFREVSSLAVAKQYVIRQSSLGVPGDDEPGDDFGSSVAVGDIDRDGYADLVIGAESEDSYRGRVTVVHGAANGWRASVNYVFSQNTPASRASPSRTTSLAEPSQ
jgi:hypothetical protein